MNSTYFKWQSYLLSLSFFAFISPTALADIGTVGIASYAGITVTNEPGTRVRVEYSESLAPEGAEWQELQTVTMEEPTRTVFDQDSPKRPHRVYRAVQAA